MPIVIWNVASVHNFVEMLVTVPLLVFLSLCPKEVLDSFQTSENMG